jgi:hypothetical protein
MNRADPVTAQKLWEEQEVSNLILSMADYGRVASHGAR